jgi:D-beta-D-heptose 7-phosphate kinase/D-beta-D-heptose 1-phosphate adenosyltransferase
MLNTKSKIVSLPTLKKKIAQWRRRGFKIAFTNGCFDILHYGHISYLEQAKRGGKRVLVVGLNSDRSVRKIKGPQRPVVREAGRAAVVAGLACVDYVALFNEETPSRLIEAIGPDILIKGADWKQKGAIGSDVVQARGGKVEFIKYIPGFSTTDIIRRMTRRAKT